MFERGGISKAMAGNQLYRGKHLCCLRLYNTFDAKSVRFAEIILKWTFFEFRIKELRIIFFNTELLHLDS
jgi:hypothetical protein